MCAWCRANECDSCTCGPAPVRFRWDVFFAMILMGLIVVALLSRTVSGQGSRDLLFVCDRPERGPAVMDCATKVYFTGDWRGVAICRGQGHCFAYTDLFPETVK